MWPKEREQHAQDVDIERAWRRWCPWGRGNVVLGRHQGPECLFGKLHFILGVQP